MDEFESTIAGFFSWDEIKTPLITHLRQTETGQQLEQEWLRQAVEEKTSSIWFYVILILIAILILK